MAKKSLSGSGTTPHTSIRLEPEMRERLRREANARRVSPSEIVRRALADLFAAYDSALCFYCGEPAAAVVVWEGTGSRSEATLCAACDQQEREALD